MRHWFTKGPITPLFRRFVWADGIPLHSKISVLAYISSYYAIACALALSLLNWVLVGLFNDVLDMFYLSSWNVFLACESSSGNIAARKTADWEGIVVFSGLSNVSSAIFQYRLNANSLGHALVGNFKVSPARSPCTYSLVLTSAVGHLLLFLFLWSFVASHHRTVSASTKEAVVAMLTTTGWLI